MTRFLLLALCSIALLTFTASAQKTSVAGEWDASMNTPGGPRPFKLVFKTAGEKLTGTVVRNDGQIPLIGTIKGNEISFSYTITYNGHDLVLTLNGKVNGDAIVGQVDFGGNGGDEWSAKRAAKPKT